MANKTEIILSAKDETRQAIDSAVGNLNRLKGGAEAITGGLSSLGGGLVAGLIGAGFAANIKSAIDSLDQFDEAAERIGITAESLSGLTYAGKLTGVQFDDLTGAIGKFSVKVGEAASGNNEAVALFKDLGISIRDAGGKVKDVDALFLEAADAFAELQGGAEKNALAADVFGKSWQKLGPLMNAGADGIRGLVDEGKKLGAVIDDKLAKQAAQFNDNMDRLATVSSAAGKSIAASFLPALNTLSENFLVAIRNSDGFWASLGRFVTMNPFKDHATRLTEMRAEYENLDFLLSNGRSKNETADRARLAALEKEIKLYDQLQAAATGSSAPDTGQRAVVRTATGTPKKEKAKTETAEATDEAKAYAKAMEQLAKSTTDATASQLGLSKTQTTLLELMQSPAWASMPETWRETAVAQFEQARASEKAAADLAQLNKLLGETDSSKLEEARNDMQLLADALERGVISEEKYLDAVQKRLQDGNKDIATQKTLAEELGLTFTSAFESAVAGGGNFRSVLKGLEQDIIKLLVRMSVTEPLGNAVKGINWGSLVSGIAGYFSGTPTANAKGGVYDSPSLSAYSGQIVSKPTMFAFARGAGLMGEAGPEAILPLKRGSDGRLGVEGGGSNVTVNVINNTDAQARTERRSDGKGNQFIEVIIEQVNGRIAGDIGRGSGPVPAAMQSVYGLQRTAGAY